MHVQDGVALRGTSLCTSLQLVSFSIFQLSEFSVLFRLFFASYFQLLFSARFWLNCFIRHVRKFSNEQQCNLGRGSAAASAAPPADIQWVTVSVTDSCSLLSKAGEVVPPLSLLYLYPSPSLPWFTAAALHLPLFSSLLPSSLFLSPLAAQPRRQFDKRIFAGSTKWTCISYLVCVCVFAACVICTDLLPFAASLTCFFRPKAGHRSLGHSHTHTHTPAAAE